MVFKKNGPYNIFSETETTIEFFHLDPLNVAWHGNYINFFEIGRRELLKKINYDYDDMKASGYAFPVIEVYAKYIKPLKYKDRISIKAILIEYEHRLKIQFEIRNIETNELATKGESIQMAFDIKTMESCFICPKILIDKVEALLQKNTGNNNEE